MSLELVESKVEAREKKTAGTCARCIIDSKVPGAAFDSEGICNFCRLHDKLERRFPLTQAGAEQFQKILDRIRRHGRSRKYDCVVGISGGRDSTYLLYLAKKVWGLKPLAVHFNNGFGNPVAGENMAKAVQKLGVELRTITSDWREAKDLKIAFLRASVPGINISMDIGIATSLYGVAAREKIKYLLIGQSFRTEGICPLSWNYLDGYYMKAVHERFGTVPLRPWKPEDPGFNLDLPQLVYYALWKGIKAIPALYLTPYIRREAEEILKKELDWIYPGAHYYDDLYQSLMQYLYRVKFGIDRRIFNYSALVRSKQMRREEALDRMKETYVIEDPKVIGLCIKRLGLTEEGFQEIMALPPRTFRDYPNRYDFFRRFAWLIQILSRLNVLPGTTYDKFFNCGN